MNRRTSSKVVRGVLWLSVIAAAVTAPGWTGAITAGAAPPQVTPPPLECTPGARPTPAQTEGPFYKPGSPERRSLIEPPMPGTRIVITGYVLAPDCRPIARAWLDFWQADNGGQYDNAGFRLRGHQFADNTGIYTLETLLPGLYPGRTRHIHVKVRAANGPTLTTQLYFAGESRNQSDGIFHSDLVVTMRDSAAGRFATFNFVLPPR